MNAMLSLSKTQSLLLAGCISLLCIAPLRAQTAEQQAASDTFLTALLQKDWTTFNGIASPMLLSQADSTMYNGIVDQLQAQLGPLQSRWLASTQPVRGYVMFVWNGAFEKDSVAMQVVVDSINQVTGVWFRPIKAPYTFPVPSYVDQESFTESRKIFGGETKLPGTLTLPEGNGPFPVVVMVAGSGPNDRDETINGNKPFRDIAWGLATQGIASFRYDKRTKAYADKFDSKTMSVEEEVIIDAIEAVKFISILDKVDAKNLLLLGHSLGGMMGPEIASRAKAVDGLILLAPPARDLVSVGIDQLKYFIATENLGENEQTMLEQSIAIGEKVLDGSASMRDTFLGLSANYYYAANTYNQVETAKKLTIPMYIAQAEKDYQVTMKEYDIWKEAIGDRDNVTMKIYPNCFHLFIEVDEPMGRANYNVEGNVTKQLIDDLATWIKAH